MKSVEQILDMLFVNMDPLAAQLILNAKLKDLEGAADKHSRNSPRTEELVFTRDIRTTVKETHLEVQLLTKIL